MVTGLTHSLHVFPAEEKARESRRGYRYLVCSSDHSIFIKLAITMLASHPPPFTPLSWRGNKPEQPDGLAAPQTAFCFRHGVGWSSTARPPRCCLEGERTWRPNFLFFLCTIDVPVDGEEPDASVRPLESDVESSFSFAPVPPPGCCRSRCAPLTSASVIKDRRAGERHTARETARGAPE